METQWALGLAAVLILMPLGWQLFNQKQVQGLTATSWVKPLALFFYFVGLPYLAVLVGIITPRLLGLAGGEQLALVDWGGANLAAQLQLALTLLLLDWVLAAPATLMAGAAALLALAAVVFSLRRAGVPVVARHSGLAIFYYGLHWAFYRAIFWAITADLYLATVLGVGAALLEWALVCRVAPARRDDSVVVNAIILVLTATVFFYSPNLWLLWPVHGLMAALVNANAGPSK